MSDIKFWKPHDFRETLYSMTCEMTSKLSLNRPSGGILARQDRKRLDKCGRTCMLNVFFGFNGIVHHEFLPRGQTINKEYYLQVQRRLREAIRKKRLDLWKNNSWFLHHDNAPAHTSSLVREFLAKNNIVTIYSPDIAPCDFFLFPKIKRTLKGRRITAIKSASLKELKAMPKIEFEKCFEDWKKRWHKCMISNGDYFEGDNINVDE